MKIIIISSLVFVILFIVKEIFRKKNKTNKTIHINHDKCSRCRVCVKKCRRNVLAMVDDEKGLHVEIQKPDNCTACNDCARACKFKALSLVDKPIK